MRLGQITAEAFIGNSRIIKGFMLEMFIEFIAKGLGGGLIRLFRPTHEPGEVACALVGILFLLVVGACIYFMYPLVAI